MKKVKLGDYADIISGSTPSTTVAEYWNGDIPWVTPAEICDDSYLIEDTERKITQLGFSAASLRLMPAGTVLLSSRAPIGKVAIAGIDLCCNQGFKNIVCKDGLYNHYLFFYLKIQKEYLNSLGRGATFKEISKSIVENIDIPLPPLDDQIRIATVLTRAEKLIAKRKESIKALDELLKIIFLEMFGDPVKNEKGWETYKGNDYSDLLTVGVVVRPASYYTDKGIVALRSLNIKPNYIDLNNLVYFSEESSNGILAKSVLMQGDVVVVRTGLTGTAAVIPKELDGANCIDLIIIRPKKNILNPYYLVFLLNSERGKKLVSSKEVGGIQKHFNIGAIKDIPFPLPALTLQNQFAAIVEKVESLKVRYTQSLTELENLYGSLSQRAFKGELDLSKVPVEIENN